MSQDIKTEEVNENHLITERREKLANIRNAKSVAFPNQFRKDTHAKDLHKRTENMDKDALAAEDIHVKMAGRLCCAS